MEIDPRRLDQIAGEEDQVGFAMPDAQLFKVIDQRVDDDRLLARLALAVLEVAITRKRRVRSLDEIDARRVWDLSAQPMRNAKSGLVALRVRQRSSLLDDGTSGRRFALMSSAS